MGRDTVTPSEEEVRVARIGVYTQLGATKLAQVHGSLANAIEVCGLHDYIENEVQCRAADAAWARFYENMLKPENVTTQYTGRAAFCEAPVQRLVIQDMTMKKPVEPFYFYRCWASFRWSFGVGNFEKIISEKWSNADYTCFPETNEDRQQIYNIFWRFIGAV